MHASNPHYRADIDGLRAIAIIFVLAFHAFPKSLKAGYLGVDVFFVISGFLISGIILRECNKGTFSFTAFYIRRARRILPALLLVLFSTFLLGWYFLLPIEFVSLCKHIAASSIFAQNLLLYSEVGYFDAAAETKPLLHLWSLAIEEQFYLVWPILIWFAMKKRFHLGAVIFALIIASLLLRNGYNNGLGSLIEKDKSYSFYMPQTRLWELASGGFLAWFLQEYQIFYNKYKAVFNWLSVISFVILLLAAANVIGGSEKIVVAVLATIGIILAGPDSIANKHILSNRLMVGIGLISYPLYLWHWPLLTILRVNEFELPAYATVLVLLASILLSILTYKIIEKPAQSIAISTAPAVRWRQLLIGITASIVCLFIGVFGHVNYQIARQYNHQNDSILEQSKDTAIHNAGIVACKAHSFSKLLDVNATSWPCKSEPLRAMNIAIIGDSHATHLFSGLVSNNNLDASFSVFHNTCLFVHASLMADQKCRQSYGFETFDAGKFDLVILALYSKSLGGILANNLIAPQILQSFANVNKASTQQQNATKYAILIDIPTLKLEPQKCAMRSPRFFGSDSPNCYLQKAEYEAQVQGQKELIRQLQEISPALAVYNPASVFCDEKLCLSTENGYSVYSDTHHINNKGSLLLGKDLLAWLEKTYAISKRLP